MEQRLPNGQDQHAQAACADLEKWRKRSIASLDNEAALNHIGTLIDASHDAGFIRGADRALYLIDELAKRDVDARHGAIC
ncbi:MAG TPA: hypothetical protein VFG49_01600 [Dyella sp.]|uniref:hypothetical protein n=1 Tax=Dyella sp. TaxID=1869338 RepID=UPI002D788DC4|nr:hypothetical protein [Dyella sp.]HET6552206.1 hypothetical protein [Dyella sp.]